MDKKRLLTNFVGIKAIEEDLMPARGKEKIYVIPMKRNGVDVELRLTRNQLNELSWLYERLEFVSYMEDMQDAYDRTFKNYEVSGIWDYVKDGLEDIDSDNYEDIVYKAIEDYDYDKEFECEDDAYDIYKDMMLMRELDG